MNTLPSWISNSCLWSHTWAKDDNDTEHTESCHSTFIISVILLDPHCPLNTVVPLEVNTVFLPWLLLGNATGRARWDECQIMNNPLSLVQSCPLIHHLKRSTGMFIVFEYPVVIISCWILLCLITFSSMHISYMIPSFAIIYVETQLTWTWWTKIVAATTDTNHQTSDP